MYDYTYIYIYIYMCVCVCIYERRDYESVDEKSLS